MPVLIPIDTISGISKLVELCTEGGVKPTILTFFLTYKILTLMLVAGTV